MPGWTACSCLRGPCPPVGGHKMQHTRTVPQLYSKEELAKRFGVSAKTIGRRIDEGMLRHHRIGNQIRISEEDALNYLAQRRW